MANAEGLCPGCRNSNYLSEIAPEILEAKSNMLIAVLRGHASFPQICPFCGESAATSSVLTWRRSSPHVTNDSGMAEIRAGLIGLIFDRLLRPRDQVISFRLPRCGACIKKKLEISKIVWDDYCLHAYCHPIFSNALKNQVKQFSDGDAEEAV
jgi:predicted RNA-binding Zn-ribbon protein involved in translation (DUF1610 family)